VRDTECGKGVADRSQETENDTYSHTPTQHAIFLQYTLCSKKSDAKIQITITTAYLIRIKYHLSGFNYHLCNVNVANFNKIHHTVSEQQLF